ncbi:hypothetical protein D3C87_1033280 [compost metagenome]
MAGYTRQLVAQTVPNTLVNDIINTMKTGNTVTWFTQIVDLDTTTVRKVLLESAPGVDAFLNTDTTQKYRLLITLPKTGANYNSMTFTFGDAAQVALNVDSTDVIVQPGTPILTMMTASNLPSVSQEVNYRITLTDRGFALGIWATSAVNSSAGQGFCVFQRPVNPTKGETAISGKAPIFAMWHSATSSDAFFEWGVVRELDVSPSLYIGTTANVSRYNMFKVSLNWPHPNLYDNNAHVVKFPYGFATRRHLYLEEMDLMCMVNAAAFAGSQDINITMYTDPVLGGARTYKSIWGDVRYGAQIGTSPVPNIVAGARIGILTVGGGIS